ncbi:hypothetical protein ACQRIU_005944 [Beauveria bassiana]
MLVSAEAREESANLILSPSSSKLYAENEQLRTENLSLSQQVQQLSDALEKETEQKLTVNDQIVDDLAHKRTNLDSTFGYNPAVRVFSASGSDQVLRLQRDAIPRRLGEARPAPAAGVGSAHIFA